MHFVPFFPVPFFPCAFFSGAIFSCAFFSGAFFSYTHASNFLSSISTKCLDTCTTIREGSRVFKRRAVMLLANTEGRKYAEISQYMLK